MRVQQFAMKQYWRAPEAKRRRKLVTRISSAFARNACATFRREEFWWKPPASAGGSWTSPESPTSRAVRLVEVEVRREGTSSQNGLQPRRCSIPALKRKNSEVHLSPGALKCSHPPHECGGSHQKSRVWSSSRTLLVTNVTNFAARADYACNLCC